MFFFFNIRNVGKKRPFLFREGPVCVFLCGSDSTHFLVLIRGGRGRLSSRAFWRERWEERGRISPGVILSGAWTGLKEEEGEEEALIYICRPVVGGTMAGRGRGKKDNKIE